MTRTVLVVEDDPTINDALRDRLVSEGHTVHQVFDGHRAVTAAQELDPDLVLLDVMLPGLDGLEVCRAIQAERPVPVLMLTARDSEADLLVGLDVGADDYLTKPFRMREVVARVAALLRRVDRARELAGHQHESEDDASTPDGPVKGLLLDARTRRTQWQGTPVHLTPTEFDLLVLLRTDAGRVYSREQIAEQLWGWSESGTRTVDTHVKAIRAKTGPQVIRTVHGVGYAAGEGR